MSSYGIPEELTYDQLSRMYPSVKTEYRKQPFSGTAPVRSGAMVQTMLNKMDRSFLNPATLALNFRGRYTFTTGGTQATPVDSGCWILGSAWSHFSRFVVKQSGGVDIDQIDNPGRLVNTIMNMTTGPIEKSSMISMGFNEENPWSNLGIRILNTVIAINNTGTTIEYTFSIPMIGSLNASKLIPLIAGDLELNFTLATRDEAFVNVGNATFTLYELDQFEIVGEVLTLEESGFQELLKLYPGVFSLKTQSYSYNSAPALPAGSGAGTVDITIPYSLNSLKQFIWWVSPSDAVGGNFAGVNPNLNSWNLVIGSTSYPQQPVKATSVAECYYQNSKSFGAFYSTSHSGSALRRNFAVASSAAGEWFLYDNNATTVANITDINQHNKFYQALDLEIINQLKTSLYSGISTRGSTNTLRMVIGRQLANVTHNIHMYACYDVVLNFDYVNGKITYSN